MKKSLLVGLGILCLCFGIFMGMLISSSVESYYKNRRCEIFLEIEIDGVDENIEVEINEIEINEIEEEAEEINKDVPLSGDMKKHIYLTSNEYNVDYEKVLAIIEQESNFDKEAVGYNVNGTKDIGLMQLNSNYYNWMLEQAGAENVYCEYDNVEGGIWYLSYLKNY